MNARRVLVVAGGAAVMFAIIAFAALMRLSSVSVVPERAAALATHLESLRLGESHYREAKAIADRYGTERFVHHYGVSDCADGYFDRCAYQIPVPTTASVVKSIPWLSAWQSIASTGFVSIWIEDGRVTEYHFTVLFRTVDDQWRGAGVDVQRSFSDTAVQARLSDSYVVARNDVVMEDSRGFGLSARLTAASTERERRQAWNLNFDCLRDGGRCGEICDVAPDVWRDFYEVRGRMDVENYGQRYRFCSHDPGVESALVWPARQLTRDWSRRRPR